MFHHVVLDYHGTKDGGKLPKLTSENKVGPLIFSHVDLYAEQ